MNSLLKYENYFKNEIFKQYEPLNDFYHIDMFNFDSFVQNLRGAKFKTPLFILEPYTERTVAQYTDNVHDILTGAFIILGNFDLKKTRPQECKTHFLSEIQHHTKQVKNKMIADKKKPCHVLKGLLINSISIAKTEIIANNFQGFRASFVIETKTNVELSDEWITD